MATGIFSVLGDMIAVLKWGLLGMAIGAAVPIVIIHGFITPIYTLRTLHIPLKRYVTEAVLRPVAAFFPFTLVLLAAEHYWQPQSLWAIFFVAVGASPVLALGAYFLAFNREERARYVHRFIPGLKSRPA